MKRKIKVPNEGFSITSEDGGIFIEYEEIVKPKEKKDWSKL